MDVMMETKLPLKLFSRGKVRETYECGDGLLMVTTDRLSAFDVVFQQGIPLKGIVLNQLSAFWFGKLAKVVGNHLVSIKTADFPVEVRQYTNILAGRTMLVKKTAPLKVECIARGYLSGSAWQEYLKTGAVCGIKLPAGLKESCKLAEPIFTPSTKAGFGKHDLNISKARLAKKMSKDQAGLLEELTLKLYEKAAAHAAKKGIIIADTKFEFGVLGNEIIWIDEALTPDSSRFWPATSYEEGKPQASFDKQFVRDYVGGIGWEKKPPAPHLPEEVIEGTSKRYIEAYERITGKKLATAGW